MNDIYYMHKLHSPIAPSIVCISCIVPSKHNLHSVHFESWHNVPGCQYEVLHVKTLINFVWAALLHSCHCGIVTQRKPALGALFIVHKQLAVHNLKSIAGCNCPSHDVGRPPILSQRHVDPCAGLLAALCLDCSRFNEGTVSTVTVQR
jgi:hypothetical protein